ncbi:MAG: hypothetical protein ACRCTQ_06835 [Brevinemataceae bacterium]
MKKFFLLVLFSFFLTSCSSNHNSIFQASDITLRPELGYDRSKLFKPYAQPELIEIKAPQEMCNRLNTRKDWNTPDMNFRQQYPQFNVELLVVNQYGGIKNFSWQERVLFADALDLLTFAINSPIFEEKMKNLKFFNNERTVEIQTKTVVDFVRNANFRFELSKKTLAKGVVAEATIEGPAHIIAFRDDVDYRTLSVGYIAMVLGHELMHNLGFLHTSNVPHGIQDPILYAISKAEPNQINSYLRVTPHFENAFLSRVRMARSDSSSSLTKTSTASNSRRSTRSISVDTNMVHTDYEHDIHP